MKKNLVFMMLVEIHIIGWKEFIRIYMSKRIEEI